MLAQAQSAFSRFSSPLDFSCSFEKNLHVQNEKDQSSDRRLEKLPVRIVHQAHDDSKGGRNPESQDDQLNQADPVIGADSIAPEHQEGHTDP
jgi:hypothetical protein